MLVAPAVSPVALAISAFASGSHASRQYACRSLVAPTFSIHGGIRALSCARPHRRQRPGTCPRCVLQGAILVGPGRVVVFHNHQVMSNQTNDIQIIGITIK